MKCIFTKTCKANWQEGEDRWSCYRREHRIIDLISYCEYKHPELNICYYFDKQNRLTLLRNRAKKLRIQCSLDGETIFFVAKNKDKTAEKIIKYDELDEYRLYHHFSDLLEQFMSDQELLKQLSCEVDQIDQVAGLVDI